MWLDSRGKQLLCYILTLQLLLQAIVLLLIWRIIISSRSGRLSLLFMLLLELLLLICCLLLRWWLLLLWSAWLWRLNVVVVDVIVIDDVGDERLLLTTRCALRAKMLLLVMGVITTLIWRGCKERRLADVSRPWMCPPINLSCQLWRWLVLLWLGIVVLILLKDLTWGQ